MCPSLSECLGSGNGRSQTSSKINESFRRVRTFSCDEFVSSIGDLVREAEMHTAALPLSSEKTNNPVIRLSPSYSRFRSLSYNDQCQTKRKSSKTVLPSANNRICQSPPKVIFGQPIVSSSPPTDHTLSSSLLANSLLIEYLALVTTDNPYGGLVEDLSEDVESKESEVSETPPRLPSPSPEPRNRKHKVGVTAGPYLAPSVLPYLQDGNPSDGISGTSTPPNLPSHLSPLLDSAVSPARRSGRCVSTICRPTALDKINPDEGVRLKKLSTQVEVDQLRSMVLDFERTHLLKNTTKRTSVTGAPPELAQLRKQSAVKNTQALFLLNSISGLTPKHSNVQKEAELEALSKLKTDATQVPLPGLGRTPNILISKPTHSETRTQTISSREHNIIAPLSF
ncbi:unnamed protein product [Hymenolepis diminuta]|uniref:Junction mediating and regulatory protein, p53 cofactor n=1 Tax=Hymenolepis diminuta TaxID=6216 RepID=A0A0R3SIQ1_HYMDI|nr:unnamed protein product [Hymenolepis diminuta]